MPTQIELIKKYGLSVRGHLGQHLLVDPNNQKKIVALAAAKEGESLLEIGPGLGALTARFLEQGVRVLAIEKDSAFAKILTEEYSEYGNRFKVINADVLDCDLKKEMEDFGAKSSFKVVSNLPYYITAPILFHLIQFRGVIAKAILMMQKEVADRIMANPGSKAYGRITLGIRYAASARHAFDVPKSCFTPQPEVSSSVMEFSFTPKDKQVSSEDEALLFDLIRIAFSQRRKTLINLLCQEGRFKKERKDWEQLFQTLNWEPKIRGEALLLKDYFALIDSLKKSLPSKEKNIMRDCEKG